MGAKKRLKVSERAHKHLLIKENTLYYYWTPIGNVISENLLKWVAWRHKGKNIPLKTKSDEHTYNNVGKTILIAHGE